MNIRRETDADTDVVDETLLRQTQLSDIAVSLSLYHARKTDNTNCLY